MPADPRQNKGAIRRYAVQIKAGGIPAGRGFPGLVQKIFLVPPAAMDYRARAAGNTFQARPPFFHQFVYRRNLPDIDLVYCGAEMPEMKVRVVETRQEEPPPPVDFFRITQGSGQGGHLRFGSRAPYGIPLNQNRLIEFFPFPVRRNIVKKGKHGLPPLKKSGFPFRLIDKISILRQSTRIKEYNIFYII
jgi:hypothetical protein